MAYTSQTRALKFMMPFSSGKPSKPAPKSPKQCSHCYKKGHIKDDHWELHGRSDKEDKGKTKREFEERSLRLKKKANTITNAAEESPDSDAPGDSGNTYSFVNQPISHSGTPHDNNSQYKYPNMYQGVWLADSATTVHIANDHNAFVKYISLKGETVYEIESTKTSAIGHGTIKLISEVDGNKYVLRLKDVLHIPNTRLLKYQTCKAHLSQANFVKATSNQ